MSNIRFSVALCTHNGGRYLQEQLDSIGGQTLRPHELIVCDDLSNDDTLDILKRFSVHAQFPVNINVNSKRLGVVKNFESAIAQCSGEFVALSDQDDLWFPDKLQKLAVELRSPDILAVFSDAEIVSADLARMDKSIWQRVGFNQREQDLVKSNCSFSVFLKHHVVTGATLAFKKSLCRYALPIPSSWAHDAWLSIIASAFGRVSVVSERLVAYRQHDNNVVGAKTSGLLDDVIRALSVDRESWYRSEILRWNELQQRLQNSNRISAEYRLLEEKIEHISIRATLPKSRWRRIPTIVAEVRNKNYKKYARNWGSMAIDLLVK